MKKIKYKWILIDNFIIIYDLSDGPVTASSDAEIMLDEIKEEQSILGKTIIFKNNIGNDYRLLIDKGGNFYGYETPINTTIFIMLGKALLTDLKERISK